MAIITPETSGAAISQGQGQGYAQVFGQSSFDPVEFAKNVAAKQEARRLQELDDELKTRERNAKYKAVVPDGVLYGEEEMYKEVEDFNKKLAEFQAMGIDIESSPEGRAILNQGQARIKSLKEANDVVKERLKHAQDFAANNLGKVDLADLDKYKKDLFAIKDVIGQAKFALENSPFKAPDYDLDKPIVDLAKNMAAQTIESGAETITNWNPEQVKARVRDTLVGMPENELQQYFEAGVKKGLWKDYAGMEKNTEERVWQLQPYKKSMDEPKTSSGMNISVGGYRPPERVNVEGRSRWDTSSGKLDEVSIAYNAKDVPPFEVELNEGGNKVRFAPSKWFVDKNGKWMVEGKSYRRTGEVTIDPTKEEVQLADLTAQVAPQGGTVEKVGDKFVTFIPLKTEVVPYDLNEIQFKSHLDGFDLYKYAEGWNKQNAKKGSGSGKTNTAPTKFTGVPQGGF